MFPQITIKHNIGNIIEIPNQINPKNYTYLSDNFAIGVETLNVDNAIDFTAGTIMLLLGSMGAENAEFGYASAHTDQTITVTATKQPHNRGDLVSEINYDEIEIQKSATIDGTYTILATLPISVTQQKTIQFDSVGLTSDYYKLRWKNSQTVEFSSFSEPVSVLSYPENSVGSVVGPVLKAMGVSENDSKINTPFCIDAINDARKYTKMKLYGVRHAWLEHFEHPIKILAGTNFAPLPYDIDFNETDRSLLAARFITGNVLAPFNLTYVDKRSWNQTSFSVGGSEATEVAAIATTTLTLESVGDFPVASATGVAQVATSAFDQTIMEIEYTGVDFVMNQLTGVTGVTREIPVGTQIWVTPTIAQPMMYTVYDDKIVFDRIIPDSMQANNLYIDYYKKETVVSNLYQELPEPYREIYKWYLRYAIKYRKDITLAQSDPDYKKFEELVQSLFDNLYTGQSTTIITS